MSETRFQKTPGHYVQYLGLKFACAILVHLPYRFSVNLSRKAVGYARVFLPNRYKRMTRDISRAFPEKSVQEIKQIALESWQNMGAIAAEFVHLANGLSLEEFKKHCRIIGAEKLTAAQGTTGGIIHIGHFTNWEAFGLAASIYGFDKAVLAQRVDNPYIDEETNRLRNIYSGRTFYSNHGEEPFFASMRWLKRKKMLGILIDQSASSSEVWLPFLGRTAAFSPITALLAIKMQVPVFPVQVSRDQDGVLLCRVLDPVLPPTQYSMDNVRHLTNTLKTYYENWVYADPASWLWAHNRWKREAQGEAYLKDHPEERL